MDKPSNKGTGLGSSLLVRRTEPLAEPKVSEEVQAAVDPEPQKREDSTTPSSQVLQIHVHEDNSAGQETKPQMIRDRCTIYLDPDVNQRLHLTARVEEKDRSQIVNEILRQHLPEFQVIHKE